MRWLSPGCWTPFFVAGLTLLVLPQVGRTQKPEKINFDTADKVQLVGTFYASERGKKAPCALLLHNLTGNRQQQGWDDLARALQKKGFAVLTFDFRGHGDSTTVQPAAFWQVRANLQLKGAKLNKEEISFKDFPATYYPMLVNDIIAAKHELDKKNDGQECNSADMIVIGAQEGAALGALWVATEYQRRNPIKNNFGVIVGQGPPEGKDIAAAIWLTISPTAGRQSMNVAGWLGPLREKVPMCFLYGKDDTRSSQLSKYMHDNVLRGDKLKLTFKVAIDGTKLAGNELLKKNLSTEELILKYVEKVMDSRGGHAWQERETKRQPFVLVPLRNYGFNLP